MSIDHVCLRVPGAQYKEMVDWYLAALKPIGFQKFAEPTDSACGLGVHRPDFWMAKHDADKSSIPVHIGFKAEGPSSFSFLPRERPNPADDFHLE